MKLTPFVFVAALALPTAAAAQSAPAAQPLLPAIAALGDFTAFAEALKATGLSAKLEGPGPFTAFAPSDAAFARIPADTMAALKADPKRFARVIAHHVLPVKVTGNDMMTLPIYTKVPTFNGDSLTIYHDKGGMKVDLSLVKVTDLPATNGVIHTVHKVILVP
ncbi:MAG: fasciclin domain-containing protein [Gemmatimonadales bacterium]|nr:fasciclin domain-containing protein [Gemmatimonadales bacterium]